jgi:FkbM family methyltransferase
MKIIYDQIFKNISFQSSDFLKKLKTEKSDLYIYGEGEYSNVVFNFLKYHEIDIVNKFISKGIDLFSNGNNFNFPEKPFFIVIGVAHESKAMNLINNFKSKLNHCIGIYYFALNPFYNLNTDMLINNWDKIDFVNKILYDNESKEIFCNYLKSAISLSNEYLNLTLPQYFPSFIGLNEQEIIIDGGAFTGDTLLEYIQTYKSFKEYHAFEPSRHNYNRLIKLTQQNTFYYNKGIGKSNEILLFNDGNSQSTTSSFLQSTFNQNIYNEVQIVKLDDTIQNATFIKLDIEGAELDALIGSVELISKYKPKMAICIYHKFEHLWEIIELVNSIRGDYKFSIRYHSKDKILTELVLYAY